MTEALQWNQVTLWGGANGWTDGTNSYGGDCTSQTHPESEMQTVVNNYATTNNYSCVVWGARPSGANCPYIDIMAVNLDSQLVSFLQLATTNSNLLNGLNDAADSNAVASLGASYGYSIDPSVVDALNGIVPAMGSYYMDNISGRILKSPTDPITFNTLALWRLTICSIATVAAGGAGAAFTLSELLFFPLLGT
jgi:Nif11 domain